jgi:3-hydroxyacyl-[acyl-carrier-protein] dehydratase
MLRDEIRQAMSALTNSGNGGLEARFLFPPAFTGFQGHFPEAPVLPGVCAVQAVLVMLETVRQRPVRLRRIAKAKFFAAVAPDEELLFVCREERRVGGATVVKASATVGNRKKAELSLEIACDAAPPGSV